MAQGDIINSNGDGLVTIDNPFMNKRMILDIKNPIVPIREIVDLK